MNLNKNIVIIGCGAGGGTAAQFARKTDRKATITIIEKGKYPQYSKCGLPYVISGLIKNSRDLIDFSENWFKKANIDLFLNTTVEKVDTNKKIVIAKKAGKVIEKPYDSLIICTGAKPFIPPIENIGQNGKLKNGVCVVRTIDDIEKIKSFAQKNQRVTIVGANLIGLEMADNLHKKEMKVTIIERLPQILPFTLDEDISRIVKERIPQNIPLFTDHIATKLEEKDGKLSKVIIKNNENGKEQSIDTDLLIIATGCNPDVELAKNAGCKIGPTGGIVVNEKSQTNVKDVFAVGDCTEYIDFVTKEPVIVGLGSIAVRQGITAGVNVAGGEYVLPAGVLRTSTSEFFGVEIASVGPKIDFIKDLPIVLGKFNGFSLPDYFPGGKPISIKVSVDKKTGRILSAQAVGENAAQRINTFACAILGGMDIETFRKLETAYAPPIAPTLDVVTLVCDIVSKKLNHKR